MEVKALANPILPGGTSTSRLIALHEVTNALTIGEVEFCGLHLQMCRDRSFIPGLTDDLFLVAASLQGLECHLLQQTVQKSCSERFASPIRVDRRLVWSKCSHVQ